ncbi:hypothetical protein TL16_g11531 [Triparma laevis f. inornata]|uniref:Aspartyl/asparaginy/proline hydroxylase domain-containing protein n=1 Tax=Triparma laevis f. inornata TaxID=1714386 RepID=A0A9W7BN69_9STRA|nr:hypothetical protein TL16_g11531 [Triparma laevis f. inornata]
MIIEEDEKGNTIKAREYIKVKNRLLGREESEWLRCGDVNSVILERAGYKPIYDSSEMPWILELKKVYPQISDEITALLSSPFNLTNVGEGRMEHDERVKIGDWKEFVIFGSNEGLGLEDSKKVLEEVLPEGTVELCREGGGEVILSRLGGHAKILPHCGPTNLRLTCHLGVKVPVGDCGIKVAGEVLRWKEGGCVVFDDGYEHEVWNETEEERVVLLIRFWNPVVEVSERFQFLEDAKNRKEEDYKVRWHPPVESEGIKGVIEEGRKCGGCRREGGAEVRFNDGFEILCKSCGSITRC